MSIDLLRSGAGRARQGWPESLSDESRRINLRGYPVRPRSSLGRL